jgi:hypothetical protein
MIWHHDIVSAAIVERVHSGSEVVTQRCRRILVFTAMGLRCVIIPVCWL